MYFFRILQKKKIVMKNLIFTVFIGFLMFSCSNNDNANNNNQYLPDQNFDTGTTINTNFPQYNNLQFPGNHAVIDGFGLNGIVVYYSGSSYIAFELSDPNHALQSCSKLTIEGVIATCGCADEKQYDILILAHTDLFQAGIARSGSYNKTNQPFGFQSERRSLFEARDVYIQLSPTFFADQVNEPVLIIHGDDDSNPGTLTFQSEVFFEAVRGSGGTARLVLLPFEDHGYRARESVEHVLWEQLKWFDKYVKGAKTKTPHSSKLD